jgi:hypothetical protein
MSESDRRKNPLCRSAGATSSAIGDIPDQTRGRNVLYQRYAPTFALETLLIMEETLHFRNYRIGIG